MCLIVCK